MSPSAQHAPAGREVRSSSRRLRFEALEVRRYLSASSFDTTFNSTGHTFDSSGHGDGANAVAVQADGKILAVGSVANLAGDDDLVLVRYNSNGSLDTTFGTGGTVTTDVAGENDHGNAVAIQSDGKIIVGGDTFDGSQTHFLLVRYNINGSLDTTYGTGGISISTPVTPQTGIESIRSVIVEDGGIYAAGVANDQFTVASYSPTGALSHTYSSNLGATGDSAANSIVMGSNGRIVAGGFGDFAGNFKFALVQLSSSLQIDSSFGTAGIVKTDLGGDDEVNAMVVDADGNLVVAGMSGTQVALARYFDNSPIAGVNGTLDTTFGAGAGFVVLPNRISGSTDVAQAIALQDGRIVYSGTTFDNVTAPSQALLGRVNSDGSIDATFNSGAPLAFLLGSNTQGDARGLAVDANGHIITAGYSGSGVTPGIAVSRFGDAVSLEGSTLYVRGTAGDDTVLVEFTSATSVNVTLNGVTTSYTTRTSSNQVKAVVFHGGVGNDQVTVKDLFNTRTALISHDILSSAPPLEFFGQNFDFTDDGTETNYVYGIASDTARVIGTPNSTAVVNSTYVLMIGPNDRPSFDQVSGFGSVLASSVDGSANVYSASGATVTSGNAWLTMQIGTASFTLDDFRSVITQSAGNANEKYYFQGNTGESFVGTPTYAYMTGDMAGMVTVGNSTPQYFYEAIGFHTVVALGGSMAHLYGSSGADLYVGTPTYSYLSGGSGSTAFFNQVNGFTTVSASSGGGADRAYFYGASAANAAATGDTFLSRSTYSSMSNSTAHFSNIAYGFARVTANASQGTAALYDAIGKNNLFVGGSTTQLARVTAATTVNATGFSTVKAFGTVGTDNQAFVAAYDFAITAFGNWVQ